MKDYTQGKIYMILNNATGMMYVGSTTITLKARWDIHRHSICVTRKKDRPLYKAIAEYGTNSFDILLLENYPCSCDEILRMRETYYQDLFDSRNTDVGYNVFRAYASLEQHKQNDHEYNVRNRDNHTEYMREWRVNNIDRARELGREGQQRRREKNREAYNAYMREFHRKRKEQAKG
jgi:group I intron endonuclease